MMHDAAPIRPPMEPASGVRRIRLAPHQMTTTVTASEDLFILAHLGVPRVDPAHWSLTIDGLVGRQRILTLADLRQVPKQTIEAVHQCCGSPTEPTVPTRRVANVRWGGVGLATLLARLDVDPRARFLWAYGLDGGQFAGSPVDWFVKDLPLQRLAAGGVLIAYELNGRPLPAEHGFPVRLVVPGYYGTNSVKWLWRLRLAEHRADGMFTGRFYNDETSEEDRAAGLGPRRPVWAIAPESVIVEPSPDTMVATGEPVEIWGWAWSFREVAAVEVSVDGGATCARAALEPRRGWAWRRFSLIWRPDERGEAILRARARDVDGTAQPEDGARNAAHSVRVFVR
ncbi:MAG: molybdopterin-dependent oxidoreductase [Alphaproteobacteria bacterium]|nr:molybdopterin-dependent oxidoreductase [Alphaproteobacteria bacterium]MCW5743514.1 molybdopterin-dependent oxidoreductase [Alphaproteobacteria bacterium]